MSKAVKAKRGRPPNKPKSGEELRLIAIERMKATAESKGQINFSETEESLLTMLDDKQLKSKTSAELKELRRIAEHLWDKFQIEKEVAEAEQWEGGYGVSTEGQQKKWDEEHAFLKPKRKNAKQTKNIYTLTDKQKEAKGIALEPMKMELDLEATEAQLEQAIMEEAILKRQREQQFPKGRRVSSRPKADPNAPPKKSFWV